MDLAKTAKTWSKTKTQGLFRHRGGKYYFRAWVGGKDKWVPLGTTSIEIAKAKFQQEKKALMEAARSGWEPQAGSIKGMAAIESFRQNLKLRVGIKETTRQFYEWSLKAILKTWPELPDLDVQDITPRDCKEWAKKFSEAYSATYFNNALLVLNEVFGTAIKQGVIYKNPAAGIELKRKTQRQLVLPKRDDFHKIVTDIRNSGHRTAQDSGDLIEFLAYTGCRISEAQRITWGDCDLVRGILLVKGDPETGTKNWRIRQVPMIPACKKLLEGILAKRGGLEPNERVLLVGDARGSLQKSTEALGLPHVSHHDLRHLFATTAIEADVDIPTISRWLGHSDGGALAMKTYGHLRDEHSQAAAKKVSFT